MTVEAQMIAAERVGLNEDHALGRRRGLLTRVGPLRGRECVNDGRPPEPERALGVSDCSCSESVTGSAGQCE